MILEIMKNSTTLGTPQKNRKGLAQCYHWAWFTVYKPKRFQQKQLSALAKYCQYHNFTLTNF